SKESAARLIAEGRVLVDGRVVHNPSSMVAAQATVRVRQSRNLRGTSKLRAALHRFQIRATGKTCLDVGAAAGGFTLALLEAGARRVYAVDTGFGQLIGELRQDRRVVNLERTNLRHLDRELIPEPVELVTVDLSYVPLSEALPQLGSVALADQAELIALVKPTFELRSGRLVVDPAAIETAASLAALGAAASGWQVIDIAESSVSGGRGAKELFLYGRRGREGSGP
ncbi:MAG: hypothetical protein J2O39_07805, partial [Acidimicrobiales bacterium]|nr:hypothetical protein [Acidimicrobiales bacterium]